LRKKIDDFENPSLNLIPEYHILSAKASEIIYIPKGYANGLKALEPNSEIMILSDMELKDSIKEKINYPAEFWLDWNQF
jgi:dTDP-4-dehydrorhamnose 3,5-epimerase